MLVYAFDIGGSSIKHGLIETRTGAIKIVSRGESVQLVSNEFTDLRKNVLKIIERAIDVNSSLTAVGISTTGSVDTNGVVVRPGFFRGYNNISWSDIIITEYDQIKVVKTLNDGRASAWGEYVSYNNDKRSHIHFVVGTGVGGGIVYNNELLMGDSGQAGYVGHMKITPNETIVCSCRRTGCLETLSSAPGIVQHYKNITGTEKNIDFRSLIDIAIQGDDNAIQAITRGGHWLGIGIGNAMNILNPTVVTVGGGVVTAVEDLIGGDGRDVYFDSVIEGIKYASHRRYLQVVIFVRHSTAMMQE